MGGSHSRSVIVAFLSNMDVMAVSNSYTVRLPMHSRMTVWSEASHSDTFTFSSDYMVFAGCILAG